MARHADEAVPKRSPSSAANDQQALDVLESCESVGIKIPEEVANPRLRVHLLAPEAMHTPISSVDTNLEVLGYRGSELLDQLMMAAKPPSEPVRVPAAGVIVRKSSDILTNQAPRCRPQPPPYLGTRPTNPFASRTSSPFPPCPGAACTKAFLEHLGRTPGHELQRVRIERAKKFLARTDQKVETIALDCGYQSINSFCVAFKRATGMSAKKFREKMRQ